MFKAGLSSNDSSVLSALFDPEASLTRNALIEEEAPLDGISQDSTLVEQSEKEAIHLINIPNPSRVEIESSITKLDAIIEKNPGYASAWNNRAQARRLLFLDEELVSHPCSVQKILDDLSRAIHLASPKDMHGAISKASARVLATAHSHRGYIILLASKCGYHQMLSDISELDVLSSEQLEEAASREFALGGRYGNETARQLAVMTNPYAKLCGSIVKEALTKEISDFYNPLLQLLG